MGGWRSGALRTHAPEASADGARGAVPDWASWRAGVTCAGLSSGMLKSATRAAEAGEGRAAAANALLAAAASGAFRLRGGSAGRGGSRRGSAGGRARFAAGPAPSNGALVEHASPLPAPSTARTGRGGLILLVDRPADHA